MSSLGNSALNIEIDRYVRRYRRGVVNSLLEFLILNYLEKGKLCGYDIITLLHERFRILLSPGQVYPVIDLMAEQGLIRKARQGKPVLLEGSLLGAALFEACREHLRASQIQRRNL